MEVLGLFGTNKRLAFFNAESYLAVSGNIISTSHFVRGVRSTLTRNNGIRGFDFHHDSQLVAVSSELGDCNIDLIDMASQMVTDTIPCNERLISLSFNYNASLLLALTGFDNQSIILWDVATKTIQFRISCGAQVFESIEFDHCDENKFILKGESLWYGAVNNILKTKLPKLHQVVLSSDFENEANNNAQLQFLAWLPFSMVLCKTVSGRVAIFNLKTNTSTIFNQIVNPKAESEILTPVDAVVTLNFVILSTLSGHLIWFPYNFALMSKSAGEGDLKTVYTFTQSLQHINLKFPVVQSLLYLRSDTLLAICKNGSVFKCNSELHVVEIVDDANLDVSATDINLAADNEARLLVPYNRCLDYQTGVVFSCQTFSLSLNKPDSSVTFVPIALTISHENIASLWKTPTEETTMSNNLLLRFDCAQLFGREGSFVTACAVQGGFRDPFIICGTNDGYVEVFYVIFREVDDIASIDKSVGSIEEDGMSFVLEPKLVYSLRLSTSFVSLLSVNFDGNRLIVGCEGKDIYLLELIESGELAVSGRVSFKAAPLSCVWDKNNSSVTVFTDNCECHAINIFNISLSDHPYVSVPLYRTEFPVFAAASHPTNFVLALMMRSHTLNLLVNPFAGVAARIQEHFVHTDQISCIAISHNNRFFATASVDGMLQVYRLEEEVNRSNIIAKHRFHGDAVIALAFSADCQVLLSFSADGVAFVLQLSRSIQEKYEAKASSNRFDVTPSNPDKNPTVTFWEKHSVKQAHRLVDMYKPNVAKIADEIADLGSRVKVLIQQNADRTDLERLPREEFVIDTEAVSKARKESADEALELKRKYALKNSYNEILAGRVKTSCYDVLESCSSFVHTIGTDETKDATPKSLSSFSTMKGSSKEKLYLERVKRLRAIEVRFIMRTSTTPQSATSSTGWKHSTANIPAGISYVYLDGVRTPSPECPLFLGLFDSSSAGAVDPTAASTLATDDVDDLETAAYADYHDIDSKNIYKLLYNPFSVRTRIQKINHLILLKNMDVLIRGHFNKLFDSLVKDRSDAVAAIGAKNTRIKEITDELQVQDALFMPKYLTEVKGSSCFEVKDSDLKATKYETKAARQKRLEEEEARRRREAESSKQDVKGRALNDMMFGTLEVKKNLLADDSVKRPEWMLTTPVNQMTEIQLKEYEIFEDNLKRKHEEAAAYRKSLEVEMKRLKVEIVDVSKVFDEKFSAMFETKLSYQIGLLGQEHYSSQIALGLVKREYHVHTLTNLKKTMDAAKLERNEVRKKINLVQAQIDDVRNQVSLSSEEEKTLDKNFKRDIQLACNNTTFDQETLKILYSMYRIRQFASDDIVEAGGSVDGGVGDESKVDVSKQGGKLLSGKDAGKDSKTGNGKVSSKVVGANSQAVAAAKGTKESRAAKASEKGSEKNSVNSSGLANAGPMQEAAKALRKNNTELEDALNKNPFFVAISLLERLKEQVLLTLPKKTLLDKDTDCPEGFNIDQFSWSKLQELRSQRIEREIHTKKLSITLSEFKSQYDVLAGEEAKIDKTITSCRNQRDILLKLGAELESDVQLLVAMRQGQDELVQDAAVTDYSDAILVPKSIVATFNNRIKEIGKEKIAILNKIKSFRRKINSIEWEAKHLQMLATHLEEYFTDLQLLRVTKDLQQILRDGFKAENQKSKLEKINARKEFLQKDAELKMMKLTRLRNNLKTQVQERRDELQSLDNNIHQLRQQVAARDKIMQSKLSVSMDSVKLNELKMKKIINRRQLVDTARAQAEEVDSLRQELDVLRQKSFPSFVRTLKTRRP